MAEGAHVVLEKWRPSNGDDDDFEFDLERGANGSLTGVKIANSFVEAGQTFVLRRYSTVMVQADEGQHKYLGYVRELVQTEDDIEAGVCWFYRSTDLSSAPADLVVCPARLTGRAGGGDKGRYKEIFFSNHTDVISVESVMHPIKVWLLPTDSLDPVTVPPEAGAGRRQLLPGFICRRMYDTQTREMMPLSEVPSRRRQLGGWVVDDVAELIRRSDQERKEFMAEWVRKSQERAARGLQAGGPAAQPNTTSMDVGGEDN